MIWDFRRRFFGGAGDGAAAEGDSSSVTARGRPIEYRGGWAAVTLSAVTLSCDTMARRRARCAAMAGRRFPILL